MCVRGLPVIAQGSSATEDIPVFQEQRPGQDGSRQLFVPRKGLPEAVRMNIMWLSPRSDNLVRVL